MFLILLFPSLPPNNPLKSSEALGERCKLPSSSGVAADGRGTTEIVTLSMEADPQIPNAAPGQSLKARQSLKFFL